MYMVTRTGKVLPKVITKVQRAAIVDLQDDISSIWGWPLLHSSRRQLCTSQGEDKHLPCSGKTLAQTKKEQCWRYDPTIKNEAFRRYAVPRYAYDSTYWSESSDCEIETADKVFASSNSEIETATMSEKDAQTHKDKILAGTKEEQLFCYDPSIKYKPLRRYAVPKFALSDTSSTDWSDSLDSESETETMAEEAAQTQKDKILAGTKDGQLFRCGLSMSESTDLQSMAEDFAKSPSTNLQSKSAVPDPSFFVIEILIELLPSKLHPQTSTFADVAAGVGCDVAIIINVKHGARSPAEGSDNDSKQAKEMDSYNGQMG